jgi:predicted GIY-YIG superfamily endonuclease
VSFWVYLLRCADGKFYTGHTDDLERRVAQHQTGGFCHFTSRRRPVSLVWQQEMQTRDDAFRAEFKIKNWSKAKKEALIAGDWARLSYFARPPRERVSTSLDTSGRERDPNTLRSSRAKSRDAAQRGDDAQRVSTSLDTSGDVGAET